MRRTHLARGGLRVGALLAVLAAPAAAEAQNHADIAKYRGPKCFSTALPQVSGSLGRVTGSREPGLQMMAEGDVVFIKPEGNGVRMGQTYLLYRVDGEIRHPRTEEVFGQAVNLLGRIDIIQVDDGRAMGRIGESCGEIERGDHLHALLQDTVDGDIDFPPFDPNVLVTEREADATVVYGASESLSREDNAERQSLDNYETYAAGDVVTIDQGSAQGWTPDTRVLLYSTRPEVAAPDDRRKIDPVVAGQGLVIYVLDRTAIVMITDGDRTVRRGTRVRRMSD